MWCCDNCGKTPLMTLLSSTHCFFLETFGLIFSGAMKDGFLTQATQGMNDKTASFGQLVKCWKTWDLGPKMTILPKTKLSLYSHEDREEAGENWLFFSPLTIITKNMLSMHEFVIFSWWKKAWKIWATFFQFSLNCTTCSCSKVVEQRRAMCRIMDAIFTES